MINPLSSVAGSPFLRAQNADTAGLAFDPGGKRLYVAACDKLHILDIDDSGRLKPVAGSPVQPPFCAQGIGVAP